MSVEVNLWKAVIQGRVEDALGSFRIPSFYRGLSCTSLEVQYQERRQECLDKGTKITDRKCLQGYTADKKLACWRARAWLESSEFDDCCETVGHGSSFVRRTFAFVQEVISLEKKLFDEFKIKEGDYYD